MRRLRSLEIATCPFANLPQARAGRWGQGLTHSLYVFSRPLKKDSRRYFHP